MRRGFREFVEDLGGARLVVTIEIAVGQLPEGDEGVLLALPLLVDERPIHFSRRAHVARALERIGVGEHRPRTRRIDSGETRGGNRTRDADGRGARRYSAHGNDRRRASRQRDDRDSERDADAGGHDISVARPVEREFTRCDKTLISLCKTTSNRYTRRLDLTERRAASVARTPRDTSGSS